MTRSNVLARGNSMLSRRAEMWHASFERLTASAMAIQKGWLAEEFSAGDALLAPLVDAGDRLDADWRCRDWLASMFREGGNIAPIWSRANGADTAVVALTWVDEYQGIFVRAEDGVAGGLHGLGDLRGSRLGLPLHKDLSGFQGAVALHGLVTALDLGGVKPKHVTFIDSAGEPGVDATDGPGASEERQIEALLSGEIDVIFLRGRAGRRATHDPRLRELVNLNQHPDPLVRLNNATLRPLTVDRAFLNAHPEVVARYLAVLLRTAAWADHHHDEVVQLLSSNEGVPSAGGFSAEDVVDAYGPDVHRSFTPALTQAHVGALEEQKNFLRDWKFLTADFSVTNWIVSEPLAEAQRLVRSQPPLVDERDAPFFTGGQGNQPGNNDRRLAIANRGDNFTVDPLQRGW